MEQTQIEEGNKLIAEFMGCYKETVYWNSVPTEVWGFKNTHITDRWLDGCFGEQTPYNNNWNLLMPVIKKINDCRTLVDGSAIPVLMKSGLVKRELLRLEIEAVWLAVVEFIQWHNKQ